MSSILSSLARSTLIATEAAPTVPVLPANRALATVYRLFPEVPYGSIQERILVNPNAAGSLWVTFLDGITPAVNGEGSFEIPPGGAWSGSVCNAIRCIFTAAAMNVTAGER